MSYQLHFIHVIIFSALSASLQELCQGTMAVDKQAYTALTKTKSERFVVL